MKFGAELKAQRLPEWRFYYLDYDELKNVLKHCTVEGKDFTEGDETKFVELLGEELDKIYSFHTLKIGEIQRRVSHCESQIQNLSTLSKTPTLTRYLEIENEINKITTEVQELARFNRLNYTGFVKIIKKHDKHTRHSLKSTFMSRLNAKPFYHDQTFEDLVVQLSKLYDVVRIGGRAITEGSASPAPSSATQYPHIQTAPPSPHRFTYKTLTFWIHPDNVMDVKMHILKFLPLVVQHDASTPPSPTTPTAPTAPRRNFNSNSTISFNLPTPPPIYDYHPSHLTDTTISSVYLDNPALALYAARLESRPDADMVRLRWYGDDERVIWVERKTYGAVGAATGGDEVSATDSFAIKEKNVGQWLAGGRTAESTAKKMKEKGKSEEEVREFERVAGKVQDSVVERSLAPVLRTVYSRTTFQLPGDSSVRISLDTEVIMIREPGVSGAWRRRDVGRAYPYLDLPEEDVYRFPYAVMEVKVRENLDAPVSADEERGGPRWVHELIGSQMVESVTRFSKYIHGVAMLMESRVSMLPFWLPQMDKDIRKSAFRHHFSRNSSVARTSAASSVAGTAGTKTPSSDEEGLLNSRRGLAQHKVAITAQSNGGYDETVIVMEDCNTESSPLLFSARRNNAAQNATGDYFATQHIVPTDPRKHSPPSLADEHGESAYGHHRRHGSSGCESKGIFPSRTFSGLDDDEDAHDGWWAPSAFFRKVSSFLFQPFGRLHDDYEPIGDTATHKSVSAPQPEENRMYLAGERTFVVWLQICVMLGVLGMGLFNFGDPAGSIVGATLLVITVFYTLYALWKYHERTSLVRDLYPGLFDDRIGPTIISVCLILTIGLNFYLRLVQDTVSEMPDENAD